jgi:hypothetical protein
MPTTIQIKRGTKSALDTVMSTTPLLIGELAYTTDTNEIYISDGTNAHLVGRAIVDLLTNRPSPGVKGRIFVDSSTGDTWVDDGSQWLEISGGSTSIETDFTNHVINTSIHTEIDDSTTLSTKAWSSQKIRNEIDNAIAGLSWRDPVLDIVTDPSALTPNSGDRYLVGSGATGDWAGQDAKIAQWNGTSWDFFAPSANWAVFVQDEDKGYTYDAETTSWVSFSTITSPTYVAGDGISISDSTISARTDNTTIKVVSGELVIGDVAGQGLSGGNGAPLNLAFTTDAHPFIVENGGLKLKVDGSTIDFDAGNGNRLYVKTLDCGTI